MKRYISGLLTGIIVMLSLTAYALPSLTAYYNPDIKLRVNGEYIDVTPITVLEEGEVNGFNLLPVRALGEALGYEVSYDANTKIIDMEKPTVESVAKAVIDSCVMVRCFKNDRYVAYGSGVVYNGYIITNKHVLDQGTHYTVEYNGSIKQYDAERVTIDTGLDIGILKSPIEAESVTLGDSEKVSQGEEIISISCPHELKNTISTGMIAAFRDVYGKNYIQVSTNAYPGESGGGLFNINSQIIAITTARLTDGKDLNMAIPINEVKYILSQLK